MGKLEGKVAIVTGAARGQGAAEAEAFAAEGARVLLTDVLDAEGEAAAERIRKEHGDDAAVFATHDVTSEEQWQAVAAECMERFGGLHVLVNNAGIANFGPVAMMSEADYREVVDVNQVGVFLGMKAAIPHMAGSVQDSGLGGSIVNISSVDGMVGMMGTVAYVASKWAVRGMTKTAAIEVGPLGIRVNSIHPGGVDTPMLDPAEEVGIDLRDYFSRVPLQRIGTPDDVARLAVFLASDDSAYCTGTEFVVDGGLLAGFGAQGLVSDDA